MSRALAEGDSRGEGRARGRGVSTAAPYPVRATPLSATRAVCAPPQRRPRAGALLLPCASPPVLTMGDTARRITAAIFGAPLPCNTQSSLKASGAMGEHRAFTEWAGQRVEALQRPFCLQGRAHYPEDADRIGRSRPHALRQPGALGCDCVVPTPEWQSSILLLERVSSSATGPHRL